MVLELDECCSTAGTTAAGEFLRHSSILGDGLNFEGVDPADEVDGAATSDAGYGDDAGVVVAVEGGVVVVEGGSGSGSTEGFFGRTAVAGLRVGCLTVSGLDRRVPLPDVLGFGRRRRSVEEGRFSVASSCWARLRFDFRLADLSAAGVRTGLSPLMSTRTVFRTVPDFIVEVLMRGDWSDLGESRLLPPMDPSVGRVGFGSGGPGSVTTVTVVEGIRSKKAASTSGWWAV